MENLTFGSRRGKPESYPPEDINQPLKGPKKKIDFKKAFGVMALSLGLGTESHQKQPNYDETEFPASVETVEEDEVNDEEVGPIEELPLEQKPINYIKSRVNKNKVNHAEARIKKAEEDEMNPDSLIYREKIAEMENTLDLFLEENFPEFVFLQSTKDRFFDKKHDRRVGPTYLIQANPLDFIPEELKQGQGHIDFVVISVEIDPISEVYIFTSNIFSGTQVSAGGMDELAKHLEIAKGWIRDTTISKIIEDSNNQQEK